MANLLHEVLAVEKSLKTTADKFLTDAVKGFKAKGLFQGIFRRYKPLVDGDLVFPPEDKEMTTTVRDKLQYVLDAEAKFLDCMSQKEVTNTVARGDVLIGDLCLVNLPATLLLSLESRLKGIRDLVESTPNLDAATKWSWDTDNQVHRTLNPVESFKTKKVFKNHVKAEATKEHPAQVETYAEDVVVGSWFTTTISGELTSLQKAQMLGRIDTLIQEVKKARQRANTQEVQKIDIGKQIMDYIMKPLVG